MTAFCTNMEEGIRARNDLQLKKMIEKVCKKEKEINNYCYPDNVLTAAMLQYMAAHDVEFVVRDSDVVSKIGKLDSQKAGKGIYGGALLLTNKAAAEKAAAEKAAAEKAATENVKCYHFQLSEREKAMIRMYE